MQFSQKKRGYLAGIKVKMHEAGGWLLEKNKKWYYEQFYFSLSHELSLKMRILAKCQQKRGGKCQGRWGEWQVEKGKCPKIDASIGKAEEMAQKSTRTRTRTRMSRTLTSVKDTQAKKDIRKRTRARGCPCVCVCGNPLKRQFWWHLNADSRRRKISEGE